MLILAQEALGSTPVHTLKDERGGHKFNYYNGSHGT